MTIMRVVTTPHPGWRCTICSKELPGGVKAGKAGKRIICEECIKKGREWGKQ